MKKDKVSNHYINEFTKKVGKDSIITNQHGVQSLAIYGSFFPGAFKKYMSKFYDFDFGSFIFSGHSGYGSLFFDLDTYIKTSLYGWNRYKKEKNIKSFPDYIEYIKIGSEIKIIYDDVLNNYNNIAPKEIVLKIKKTIDLLCRLLVSTVFCEAFDLELLKSEYNLISKRNTNENNFVKYATLPSFESFIVIYDKLLLNAFDSGNWKKVFWTFTNYYQSIDVSDVNKEIVSAVKEKGGRDLIVKEINESIKISKKNKILNSNFRKKLSPEEKKLFDFSQLAMEMRDRRKEFLMKIMSTQFILIKKYLESKKIDVRLAPFAFCNDFLGNLHKSSKYGFDLRKREKGFLLYADSKKYIFEYNLNKIKKTNDGLFALIDKNNTNSLTGSIANKGYSKGIVKVILNNNDFVNFNKGDVLVTSMTRPEFVPLMKKAAAVVTDEGGITCHAAIISRELNIPCIIGTKSATRVLKNGDLVEVDANNGVVKILTK